MSREHFARGATDDIRISADALTDQVAALFERLGCQASVARRVAESLVESNLLGHDSHGVSLVPLYVRMLLEDRIPANGTARITRIQPGMIAVDAGRMLGQVVARQAMCAGIDEARQAGLALVALRDSHHIGRIGEWAEQCAEAGLASLHFVNVIEGPPVVAPWGGSQARLHTNPIAVGIPRAGQEPIILDFATSRSAQGKMRVVMARGDEAPEGYLIDAAGAPSRDPSVVYGGDGAILPFGEHKGFGLALICDLLCGAVAGGRSLHDGTIAEGVYLNNMVSFIFDMDCLSPEATRSAEMETALAYVRAARASTEGPVRLPGDGGRAEAERRRTHGIPVDAETWSLLAGVMAEIGLPPLSSDLPRR